MTLALEGQPTALDNKGEPHAHRPDQRNTAPLRRPAMTLSRKPRQVMNASAAATTPTATSDWLGTVPAGSFLGAQSPERPGRPAGEAAHSPSTERAEALA